MGFKEVGMWARVIRIWRLPRGSNFEIVKMSNSRVEGEDSVWFKRNVSQSFQSLEKIITVGWIENRNPS